ncbi:DNA topoisomerase 3-alpha [Bienertia sinuspersici]
MEDDMKAVSLGTKRNIEILASCLQEMKASFSDCRNVVWLPGSISEAAVTSNTCNVCTPGSFETLNFIYKHVYLCISDILFALITNTGPVFLIQFKFRQLEIPPNYNVDHLELHSVKIRTTNL